ALARRFRAALPGWIARGSQAQAVALPPPGQSRSRIDRRPDPRLGSDARVLEPRQDGLLGEGPHSEAVGGAEGRTDDGVLQALRAAVSLGAGRPFHARRRISLLDPGPHTPEPADGQ